MTKKEKVLSLKSYVSSLYPKTEAFLLGKEDYQFLIAVILSAQSTDKNVNKVTPVLFDRYKTLKELSEADENEVLGIIRPVGLGKTKSHNIVELCKTLIDKYKGEIPNSRKELESLPGVGHKTAGVFLAERRKEEYIPVDTHISRISYRLGLCKKDEDPSKIEDILEKNYLGEDMINFHRQLILFGRNICLANNKRRCDLCSLNFCKERKK